ncbi:MAG TPA: bifunctional 3,4-dihydroxy-2-butanone-4-phosphate synthase/GTP cyclohydrolase II, partial [Kandleria vitulina]|nr:bifunctional 3,4-dihydroxy-2-butanone-4-phosphate synthase/GTP cyclohydrolase II [Kandleria vitulina]
MKEFRYGTIEQALEDLRQGKIIMVSDDEDRENEGDMICAAEFASTENINKMASLAKGLICTPMSKQHAERLGLPPMVLENTDNHGTAFTVSIDHIKTTTGISAEERGMTIQACASEKTRPEDLRRPG